MKHKNSQKRVCLNNAIYFITFNTYNNFPFFNNDILCRLFIKEFKFCQSFQFFDIFGYKINPEHIHILISPCNKFNYSQIMGSLKRNFTRDANRLILPMIKGDDTLYIGNDIRFDANFKKHRHGIAKFIKSHKPHFQNMNIPKFKWQKSFHDHYIRDEIDFFNHVKYIENQYIKHGLSENKWVYLKI